jgi:glycosyltransferase involved in cell wall biosynthesis
MADSTKTRIAVVVPAYNEESRIANVLWAAVHARLADEVIVVTDGCSDNTAAAARKFPGVNVIECKINRGKGAAMLEGARAARADFVVFLDADLIGLRSDHVDMIAKPLLSGTCDMCIGIFRGGKFWSDAAQKFAPTISGQRGMRRSLFLGVPYLDEMRMGVEVAINAHVKRQGSRIRRVILQGVSNSHKEQKLGIVEGGKARLQMWSEIVNAKRRILTETEGLRRAKRSSRTKMGKSMSKIKRLGKKKR